MLIIGCDYHPGFQQIAVVDTETGECGFPGRVYPPRRTKLEGAPFLAFFARSGAFHVHPSQTCSKYPDNVVGCLKASSGFTAMAICISSPPAAIIASRCSELHIEKICL